VGRGFPLLGAGVILSGAEGELGVVVAERGVVGWSSTSPVVGFVAGLGVGVQAWWGATRWVVPAM
jgi:hypothetical protein